VSPFSKGRECGEESLFQRGRVRRSFPKGENAGRRAFSKGREDGGRRGKVRRSFPKGDKKVRRG